MMNRRSKEIMTIVVVAATVILIVGFIVTVILFKTEEIDKDRFTVISFFLSTTLMTIVIVYAALVTSNGSARDRYVDYLKDKNKEDSTGEPDLNNHLESDGN